MAFFANQPKINLFGLGVILFAGFILFRLFNDPIKQEIKYATRAMQSPAMLIPQNTDFALTVDKIGASANIVKSVDPYNSEIYQRALRDGVAHAKGTSMPGERGNVFLFAHSSADLLTAERYNSIFYLMHHLVDGDVIKVWKDDVEYDYEVSEKLFVAPSDLKYLTAKSTSEQLTLMTCWPPGTTYKRLIIIAKPI